jgi:serine/threonine protein phosphatase PrpC
MSRQNHSDYLMWESGYCSKVGIRDSQEDRFSFHPNINDQIRQAASSHHSPPSSSGAMSTPSQPNGTLGGGVENAGGYFGVYDGHGGQPAAIYLEKNLLGNICAHRSFTDDLRGAVVDSCIRTDKDFLVSPWVSLPPCPP